MKKRRRRGLYFLRPKQEKIKKKLANKLEKIRKKWLKVEDAVSDYKPGEIVYENIREEFKDK